MNVCKMNAVYINDECIQYNLCTRQRIYLYSYIRIQVSELIKLLTCVKHTGFSNTGSNVKIGKLSYSNC